MSPRNVPVQSGSLSDIVSISSGYGHLLAIAKDGNILGIGWNGFGQLGDGTTTNKSTPTLITIE